MAELSWTTSFYQGQTMPNYGSLGRIVTGLQARKREILKKGTGHGKWCEAQGGHGESWGFIAISHEQINAFGNLFCSGPCNLWFEIPGNLRFCRLVKYHEISSLHHCIALWTCIQFVSFQKCWWSHWLKSSIPSMYSIYFPTNLPYKSTIHVGKKPSIHGRYFSSDPGN